MKRCVLQQSAFSSTREEIRSSVSVPDWRDPVVCPKPRRLGLFNDHNNNNPIQSLKLNISHQVDTCDSKAGLDVLEILSKGGYGTDQSSAQQVGSVCPPFFCGSPPSRVANPLVQDARFGDEKFSPFSPLVPVNRSPSDLSSSSPNSSARKGGRNGANFGNKPAVRIEGFDCLDRDCRNCSIPTLA